jgi:hypothetical protein
VDPQYRDYFQVRADRLLSIGLGTEPQVFGAAALAQEPGHVAATRAVEAAALAVEGRTVLRPDASVLLYLLSSELVARPLLAGRVAPQEFEGDLAQDARTVVEAAASVTDDGEVSAHQVIDGLSRSWDQLATARWGIWDRRGRRAEGP